MKNDVRPLSRNPDGSGVVSVTVPAASSNLALTPAGTPTPSSGDLLAGSAVQVTFAATWLAVSFEPSAQVTSGRRVSVTESGRTSHVVARPGAMVPSARRLIRVSYANV